jgi:peroxiredoxin
MRRSVAIVGVLAFASGFAVSTTGCEAKRSPPPSLASEAAPAINSATPQAATSPIVEAKLGAAAPDFELADLDGNKVSLAKHRGSIVVLEWFNPECPFVKKSHTKGSLVDTAARQTKEGVVWLAVNSNAAGKQGHGAEKNREGREAFKMTHPILLDEDGRVGKAYGAARTPHMYVIDQKGNLAYRGAIDNSPDGEGESPAGGKLVNYVDGAIADLRAGKAPSVTETEPYGCSVKYAK